MITLGDIRRATHGMSDSAVMELEATDGEFRLAFRQEPNREIWRTRRPAIPPTTYVPDPRD